jgi:uncharacterized protein (TIGR02099 family)
MNFPQWGKKLAEILAIAVAGLVLLLLVLTLALKLLLDRAPQYQAEMQNWVNRQTGFHVRFAHVTPTLRWYGPELYFDQLELRSKDDHRVLARAAGGRMALDVWQLLRRGKLLAGRVQLDGPNLVVVRLGPTSFALASEIELKQEAGSLKGFELDELPAGNLIIRGAHLTVQNWNAALPQLVLSELNVDLRRYSDMTITASAILPAILGGAVNLTGSVSGEDSATLSWGSSLYARNISFAGWRLLLPEYLNSLESGSGTFTLTGRGLRSSLTTANLEFKANDVTTTLVGESKADSKFNEISGNLSITHSGDRWTLLGRRVRTLQAGRSDPASEFDVTWRGSAAGLVDLRAQASYVRAESILPLAGLLPQKDVRDRIRDLALTGEWSDAFLQLERLGKTDPWDLRVRGKFRDAGFAATGSVPGMRGMTGTLEGTDSGGRLELNTQKGLVVWPSQWSQPVELTSLKGNIYWKRSPDQLLVASSAVAAANRDVTTATQFSWQQPSDGSSPLLTLVSTVENGNVANARWYFPHGFIPPKALEWLDHAFVAGHLAHADVLFRGPVRNFPFRDGSGLFVARCALDGMTLDYQQGWPPVDSGDVTAEFRNEGMSGEVRRARVGHIEIGASGGRFVDFKTGELEIHATASGDSTAALEYLRATPLDALAEHLFSGIDASGPMQAKIELLLPFKEFDRRRVLVQARLQDVSLRRAGSNLAATGLTGELTVDGAQVSRADIRGRLLGGAFQVLAHQGPARQGQARASLKNAPARTWLEFRGVASGDSLRSSFELPTGISLSGQTDWRATLRINPEPNRERSLRISSSLAGLALSLPEPLAKSASRLLPAWLDLQWPATGGVHGRLALDSLLQGAFVLESGDAGLHLVKGAFNFGSADPVFSDSQIINVSGGVDRLDLAGWLRMSGGGKESKPLAYYMHSGKLKVGELHFLGLVFREVSIDLQLSDSRWHIDADGPSLSGRISPPAEGSAEPWNLQFARLKFDDEPDSVGGDRAAASDAGEIDPRNIPAIKFHAAQLIWGARQLGDLEASLSKREDGVTLDQLTMTGSAYSVKAKGEWRGKNPGLGRIEGTLTSTDVQNTLTQLGYAPVIDAKSGRLDFDLNWVGAPTLESLGNTIGHVQVSLEKGQVLGIKPGAGRVLGLASVAALPRRLALDFSDLTDKGLAFDSARGDFDLRDGNAFTDNVLLKGPAAEIGLIGRIGLKSKDYDQTAVVTGSVGNSLPLAGALAGGPVIGAAVLVFTQVFKQPLRGLARAYYRITGSWDNPVVERVKSAEAAAAEAAEAPNQVTK